MKKLIVILFVFLVIFACSKNSTKVTTTTQMEMTTDIVNSQDATVDLTTTTTSIDKKTENKSKNDSKQDSKIKETKVDKKEQKQVKTDDKKDKDVKTKTKPKTELEMVEDEVKDKTKDLGDKKDTKTKKDVFDELE